MGLWDNLHKGSGIRESTADFDKIGMIDEADVQSAPAAVEESTEEKPPKDKRTNKQKFKDRMAARKKEKQDRKDSKKKSREQKKKKSDDRQDQRKEKYPDAKRPAKDNGSADRKQVAEAEQKKLEINSDAYNKLGASPKEAPSAKASSDAMDTVGRELDEQYGLAGLSTTAINEFA